MARQELSYTTTWRTYDTAIEHLSAGDLIFFEGEEGEGAGLVEVIAYVADSSDDWTFFCCDVLTGEASLESFDEGTTVKTVAPSGALAAVIVEPDAEDS